MSKSNRLKVKGLPRDVSEAKLRKLFEDEEDQGGGPVDKVEVNREEGSAIITFEDAEAVDTILDRGSTVKILKQEVKVVRLVPKKSTQSEQSAKARPKPRSPSPASEFPEPESPRSLVPKKSTQSEQSAKTKPKPRSPSPASEFPEPESPRSLPEKAAKPKKKTTDKILKEKQPKGAKGGSKNQENKFRKTIKAKVVDVTKSKDSYFYYLTDPKVSDGDLDEDSILLDGLQGYLYVTFRNDKDVRSVCRLSHGEDSNFECVEVATEDDFDFYSNLLSVHGYPFDSEDSLNDIAAFVENVTDFTVKDIIQYDEKRSIILEFDPAECEAGKLGELGWLISEQEFNDVHLITAPVYKSHKVMVHGLKESTTDDTLVRYLSHSRSGGDRGAVISPVDRIGSYSIVTFKSEESVKSVLSKTSHKLEGKQLQISHFHPCLTAETYENFIENHQPVQHKQREKAKQKSKPRASKARSEKDSFSAQEKEYRDTQSYDREDEEERDKEEDDEMGYEDEDVDEEGQNEWSNKRKRDYAEVEKIKLEDHEFDILLELNVFKDIEQKMNIRVTADCEDKHCVLEGDDKEAVQKASIEIYKKPQEFKSRMLNGLREEQRELLRRQKMRIKLKEKWQKHKIIASLQIKGEQVIVHYLPPADQKLLDKIVNDQVYVEEKHLDEDALLMFQSPRGQQFLAEQIDTDDDYEASSFVKLTEAKSLIIVSKFKRVMEISKEVDRFMKEYKLHDKEISVPRAKQDYVAKYKKSQFDDINNLLNQLGTNVHPVPVDNKICLKGPLEGISQAEASYSDLYNGVVTQDFDIPLFGVQEFLKRSEGKELLQKIEDDYSCLIGDKSSNSSDPVGKGRCPSAVARMKVKDCSLDFMQDDILNIPVDVVVNPVDASLKCKTGMGKAILSKGGQDIERQLKRNQASGKEIIFTSSGQLDNFKGIIHVVCPEFGDGMSGAVKDLKAVVQESLREAAHRKFKSIVFPMIGTGRVFKFPEITVETVLMEAIKKHLKEDRNTSLRQIVVCDRKAKNLKGLMERCENIFESYNLEKLRHLTEDDNEDADEDPAQSAQQGSGSGGKNFGRISVRVLEGELSQQKADVIVSAVDKSLDLGKFKMSQAIVERAGSSVQEELSDKNNKGIRPGEFAATVGGNLDCSNIFFACLASYTRGIETQMSRLVVKMLEEADKNDAKSMVIPALGTGGLRYPADISANAITDAISQFALSHPRSSLRSVSLVLYPRSKDVPIFKDIARQSEHSERRTETRRGRSSEAVHVSDRVSLTVYGESRDSCDAASKALIQACKKNYNSFSEDEDGVRKFQPDHVKELVDFGLKHQLRVTVNNGRGKVTYEGFINRVGERAFNKKFREVMAAAVESRYQTQLKKLPKAFQWQFKLNNKWKNFEPGQNNELEMAYDSGSKTCDIEGPRGHKYRVDFHEMKEYHLNRGRGEPMEVQRLDLTKEEPTPKEWDAMGVDKNFKLVSLTPTSEEYKKVAANFHAGGSVHTITSIERVQNRSVYQQYAAKRREIEGRNPKGIQNEKILFHGTDASKWNAIAQNGFSRNYSGINAANYGDGVYFAINSSYSVAYCQADSAKNCRIFQARVLVGESTVTQQGMKAPPLKPSSLVPFDSGSDNANMYIIFHDAQAYPEYLITFKS